MRPTDFFRTLIAFIILVMLHYTLRPLLGWRAGPDFLVIATLLVAIRVRPGAAALIGLCVGLVSDSVDVHVFGAGALAMSAISFTASWLKAVFFADDALLNALFFFLGKWAFDAIFVLAGHRGDAGQVALQIFVWSPLSAAVTALFGLVTLLILRPVLRASSS
jgi:rod shape-determining protein MreD